MAHKDKIKWEKKYSEDISLLNKREASYKLKNIMSNYKINKALDLACGTGRNSIFLAKNNICVDAYDISATALKLIDNLNFPNIKTKEFDLDTFNINFLEHDLIIMCNFLDRKLINKISKAMKKDSLFFIETFMEHEINEKKNSNPNFLLKKNELESFFNIDNFKILEYNEYENEKFESFRMMKQSIIVKKLNF